MFNCLILLKQNDLKPVTKSCEYIGLNASFSEAVGFRGVIFFK